MKNILYLNNFISPDILNERQNEKMFSQPANNKIIGILNALNAAGCKVTVLSSGLVNSKSGRWYQQRYEEYKDYSVIYCGILDIPLFNTITSIVCMYMAIKQQNKKNKIDNIIFYNYKPEVAWAAYLAKKHLHIPITVEYEDGYSKIEGLKKFKSMVMKVTENIVSQNIDSAILVNSMLQEKYSIPTAVVRGVVDEKFLEECRNYKKVENDKFTLLYSGGLGKARGIKVLLDALNYLDIDCKVIVTGKGKLEIDDSRVDFKGFVSHDEVKLLMKQADVLLQCQLTSSEFANVSFPSKLFEYICTGNHIISSAMRDVVDFAGDCFKYYSDDDPKELARAIKELYNEKNESASKDKMSELCHKNIPLTIGQMILKCLG